MTTPLEKSDSTESALLLLPFIGGERDDCIAPLATRYGLGYTDGISKSRSVDGAIAFVPASRAGAEASYIINDVTE